MRLNKYIALYSNLSRRSADEAIKQNRIQVNGQKPAIGQQIDSSDQVMLDGTLLSDLNKPKIITIILNKPLGYVCSKDGQGAKTVYDLLPKEYANLNTVGRLDKDSSGLILLTNDGDLHNKLTHPANLKNKEYVIKLDKSLLPEAELKIINGIMLSDGLSKLDLIALNKDRTKWQVTMHEGRNRQIRRTFNELGYKVAYLHRIKFDNYKLESLKNGEFIKL